MHCRDMLPNPDICCKVSSSLLMSATPWRKVLFNETTHPIAAEYFDDTIAASKEARFLLSSPVLGPTPGLLKETMRHLDLNLHDCTTFVEYSNIDN